ncbi:MAG: Asp-tRNA(Asn)/Glu-tRNA(Gln) amidotransferase subunit GatC [Synechococcales cyanobacterium RM1_1_8]|nr:Asp-tRNA(Asn)/Glu-tRNA(Gln) amidotransferase subunit GatC [Synechococcales cyanobacterium RM1_1_8]
MIDRDQVRHVANLSRLALTASEETALTGQLNSILDYFEQLSELDTDGIEPTTRAIDVSNVCRQDILTPAPNRDQILDCAPERDGDFIRVPQIMGDS